MEEWEFRDRLRRLIEEKGLSARKMSRRLGRNDSYIQNILSGGALPSMRMFLKICAFLRITPETFWSGGADAGGVLAQKLRRLDERQLGVLSALVDILTARNGRSRSRRQGRRPPDGKLPMPPGGNFSARARAASPTAGRQVSPAVGRRTSAAVGQHTSHVVGRQTFLTVGRAIPLAGGKRASPAVARGRRCFLRLLGQCCPDLRVAAQALDKRSVSVDRMAGLSEKVFLPLFGGRRSHTAVA